MNKEDYSKYYIQGSDHYLIPKDVFIELFNEMSNWREESKEYEEIIYNAIKKIEHYSKYCGYDGTTTIHDKELNELLKILEGEENEE